MNFPPLIIPKFCQTPISVVIYGEGLTENGEPEKVFEADLKCNYQDGAKTAFTAQKKSVEVSGVALLCGDIAPGLAVISSGEVVIFGEKRQIYRGTKARNLDGTVNYTKLELV